MTVTFASWVDVQVPWDPLDEGGDEEPFEDTVSLKALPTVPLLKAQKTGFRLNTYACYLVHIVTFTVRLSPIQ